MKKLAILFLVLLVTGCSVVRIDTNNIDNIIDVVLSKRNTVYNRIGKGYKYYIPRGVTYIDTNELNDKLYSNGVYYYLYIDVVSYYYKTKPIINNDLDTYYFRKIKGKKSGYVNITEQNGLYKIEFLYNYAKIEAKVKKEQIEEVILNASYILSTVKFNNNVIKLMLDDEYFINKEEQYDLFTRKETENYFLGDTVDDKKIEEENIEEKENEVE